MKSYQEPNFQERMSRAAEAKKKALDALRSRDGSGGPEKASPKT